MASSVMTTLLVLEVTLFSFKYNTKCNIVGKTFTTVDHCLGDLLQTLSLKTLAFVLFNHNPHSNTLFIS